VATFQGTSSNNTFDGTTGDDLFLMADGGSDTVRGDAGNDTFDFGAAFDGNDSIVGGPGTDLLLLKGNYEAHGQGMMNVTGIETIHLAGHRGFHISVTDFCIESGGSLTIDGRQVRSSGFVDASGTIVADATLALYGGKGGDALTGGAKSDTIYGGLGQDSLRGDHNSSDPDDSADRFLYKAAAESTIDAPDTVSWDPTEGDRIHLRKMDADSTTIGDQKFEFIGTDAFSHTAGELRYETSGSQYLITGDVDGDGDADFAIRTAGNNVDQPDMLIAHYFVL
jgi:Ca2+-binding RTX toxin-like protein